ncbi:hypothetical protein IX317_001345 [Fusobacterium sp. DD29]|uniref:DMT family transporter n=1 Tax=unclassified Fusobacterium TaxID=2648384 RepID=UPI001B8D0240|nr:MULTISPECIES: DMT family transporter [unclassified Fusobacterium]MBR8701961.1 hypothetical protein [Fusobacterium sp. DD45]MBR8711774.1 hypothetical protein [Fusobacterium sp. DD28]MBR8749670.1 hypothetical protein [Fusobacterium sp. DD29]MBR8752336.1 hypothetical protein [Fusobacterium sp. DD26]MBR8761931.1 hypothetical protein [Fusobacterium sp. DD25]
MNEKKGNLFVFLGALFWSLNAPIVSGVNLPPLFLSCYRSVIAGIVLLPFLRIKNFKISKELIIFLFSYFGLCASITIALKNTVAPIAIGMQYASIFWIFIINFFILKIREYRKIPAILLILIGVILFMTSGNSDGSAYGNAVAFFESIFFTGMTISANKIKNIEPISLTCIGNLFTGLILLVFIGSDRNIIFHMSMHEYIAVSLLGVVNVALGYGCYNIGVKYTTAQNASLIAILEMVLGPLWVYIFLHRTSNTQTMIGFAFILVGLLLNHFLSRKKP